MFAAGICFCAFRKVESVDLYGMMTEWIFFPFFSSFKVNVCLLICTASFRYLQNKLIGILINVTKRVAAGPANPTQKIIDVGHDGHETRRDVSGSFL